MKKICVMIAMICSVFFFSPSNSLAKESTEQLLESALLNRYYSVIRQVTEDQYECDSVTNIKRLGKKDEFIPRFEVTIQFLTFQGAHNPPNDQSYTYFGRQFRSHKDKESRARKECFWCYCRKDLCTKKRKNKGSL